MMFVVGGVVWVGVAAFAWALCKAAAAGDAVAAIPPIEVRREVGTCGSCGGPIMLKPSASAAVCPCGRAWLPSKFLRYGEPAA